LLRLRAKTVGSASLIAGFTERLAPVESGLGSSLTTAEIPPR
jgi:hypothetical protein